MTIFDYNRSKIELFDLFTICWNRFHCDDSKSNDEFGLEKLNKRRFESRLKQILALGRLNRISLVDGRYRANKNT